MASRRYRLPMPFQTAAKAPVILLLLLLLLPLLGRVTRSLLLHPHRVEGIHGRLGLHGGGVRRLVDQLALRVRH
eukprot:3636237-Pyramimonas_sp.AAC.1